MNRATRIVGALSCLLAAGCAHRAQPPEPAPPATQALPPVVAAVPPAAVEPQAAPAAGEGPDTAATPAPVEPVRPAAPPAAPRPAAKPPVAVAAPPPAATPVKPPAATAPAPPVAAKPSAPPLDLASLETRLKETKAIGVFTKISLKNQVDDLLNKFRAYYKRQTDTTLTQLRRPYDMLLMKVLSLLQDSDPPLAHDIVASKEAIWGILADPQKFTEANLMAGETP